MVSYGIDKVFNDVLFLLLMGKIIVLIGFNGCGKLMLLNCFLRFLMLQFGIVFFGDNFINMFLLC